MSYESPIEVFTKTISNHYSEKADELVMNAVMKIGVEVDKDELVKALAYDRDQYEKGFHDGMMANKWIPTSERLPDGFCLVTLESGVVDTAWCVHCKDGSHYWEQIIWNNVIPYIEQVTEKIIAWMPLPEPYEEVAE